jgi:hypothetical protein
MNKFFNHQTFKAFSVFLIPYFCYCIVFFIVFLLGYENFVYSNSFGDLTFRGIDDVAFQTTLRRIHLSIDSFNLMQLVKINDYGYGWIYWFVLAVCTYPFYLLNKYYSIAWPLIVAPRQISLIFSCLSLYYLFKLFKVLEFDKVTSSIALLCFSLLPSFGYFSLRFGTVSSVMFFSLLSLYFAFLQYKSKRSQNIKSLVALSIGGAIKLNGLFIAPLTFLLLSIDDLKKKKYKEIIFNFIYFTAFLIFFTIPFIYLLPLAPFINSGLNLYYQAIINYINMMKHFIGVTNISAITDSPFKDFIFGVFHNFYIFTAYVILFFGMFSLAFKSFLKRYALLFLLFAYIPIVYLFFNVRNVGSAGIYFTSISFIFFLGINFVHSKIRNFILFFILSLLSFSLINQDLLNPKKYDYSHFSYFFQEKSDKSDFIRANKIDTCLNFSLDDKKKNIAIATDYEIKSNLNPLELPSSCFVYIFSNLSNSSNSCKKPFDYFLIDSSAIALQNDLYFYKNLYKQDQMSHDSLLQDRRLKSDLVKSGKYEGSRYRLLCTIDNIKIYKLIN